MGRNDLLALAGALMFVAGVAWVFPPAGLVVAGLLALGMAVSRELF